VLDGGGQGNVAEGGGVSLAGGGEPAQERYQGLPGGLAGLAGVDQHPAVAADRVGGGAGSVDRDLDGGAAGGGQVGGLAGTSVAPKLTVPEVKRVMPALLPTAS
jgi:hypothetical protein